MIVQSRNVYPDLLLARLLFSVGAAASSVMITAILPSIAASSEKPITMPRRHDQALSTSAIAEATESSEESPNQGNSGTGKTTHIVSSSRLAGVVGIATGVGALLALLLFLRLPALLQRGGAPPTQALKRSFYFVGVYSILYVSNELLLPIWCNTWNIQI